MNRDDIVKALIWTIFSLSAFLIFIGSIYLYIGGFNDYSEYDKKVKVKCELQSGVIIEGECYKIINQKIDKFYDNGIIFIFMGMSIIILLIPLSQLKKSNDTYEELNKYKYAYI